jgi:hypothetical protein
LKKKERKKEEGLLRWGFRPQSKTSDAPQVGVLKTLDEKKEVRKLLSSSFKLLPS